MLDLGAIFSEVQTEKLTLRNAAGETKNAPADRNSSANRGVTCYGLFGLTFESAGPIPGLDSARSFDGGESVRIEQGSAPRTIANVDYENANVQASATEYLFHYPDVLRLYVDRGARIVVEPLGQCHPVSLWSFVLGLGASIAGLQRGFIALHASAVVAGSKCIAFAGQSGTGKSTLAASLIELGFHLHAEDLCLLQPRSDGTVMVGSGVRELRLWDDAVASLNWSRAPCLRLAEVAKSVYQVADEPRATLPLSRIYTLEFSDETTPPGIYPVHGVAALRTLIDVLRLRPELLRLGDMQLSFRALGAACAAVPIFRFVRPRDSDRLWHWSRRLADHFSPGEAQQDD